MADSTHSKYCLGESVASGFPRGDDGRLKKAGGSTIARQDLSDIPIVDELATAPISIWEFVFLTGIP